MSFSIDQYNNRFNLVESTIRDQHDRILLSHRVRWDDDGNIDAEYLNPRGEIFFREHVGKVGATNEFMGKFDQLQAISEIGNRHLEEVTQTLMRIGRTKPIQEAISKYEFQALRILQYAAKIWEAGRQKKVAKFKDYLDQMQQRMMNDHHLRLNAFGEETEEDPDAVSSTWNPIHIIDGRGVIRDNQLPLEASFARLLATNRYSKVWYPHTHKIIDAFNVSRIERLDFINLLLEGYGVQSNDVDVSDYELYDNGVLVFRKEGKNLTICDQERFRKLCSPPKNRRKVYKKVDEKFIDKAIKNAFIPEKSRRKLREFIGHRIHIAIDLEASLYGNLKRVQKIKNEEIDELEQKDRSLYGCIQSLCDPSKDDDDNTISDAARLTRRIYKYHQGNPGTDPETGIVGRYHEYQGYDWRQLKNIRKYLTGEVGAEVLSLNRDSAPLLLKIMKMFDLAVAELNCMRREKMIQERGSYDLRTSILELLPDLSSLDAYSRTLFPARLSQAPYRANIKNFMDKRVGLHSKLAANTYILARSLAERMPTFSELKGNSGTQGIVAARGNTGAGKSQALGDESGILNVDPVKRGLREVTSVTNKQSHTEGAMLFNCLFVEFTNNINRYIVDLRLLDIESLNRYVLNPARMHQTPVMIQDYDVPLFTSLNRVLKRNPRGKEPCPSLDPIVMGFQKIRENRREVIRLIEQEELVKEYHLHYLGKKVASKVDGEFRILDEELFEECLQVPTGDEIEAMLDRVIDDSYIQEARARRDLRVEELECLVRWKGETVRNAIERHADS